MTAEPVDRMSMGALNMHAAAWFPVIGKPLTRSGLVELIDRENTKRNDTPAEAITFPGSSMGLNA